MSNNSSREIVANVVLIVSDFSVDWNRNKRGSVTVSAHSKTTTRVCFVIWTSLCFNQFACKIVKHCFPMKNYLSLIFGTRIYAFQSVPWQRDTTKQDVSINWDFCCIRWTQFSFFFYLIEYLSFFFKFNFTSAANFSREPSQCNMSAVFAIQQQEKNINFHIHLIEATDTHQTWLKYWNSITRNIKV